MSSTVTLTLSRRDAGQILDGLQARCDSWEATAEFLETGHNPDNVMIEECSDAEEAYDIAHHYQDIINQITTQMNQQKG